MGTTNTGSTLSTIQETDAQARVLALLAERNTTYCEYDAACAAIAFEDRHHGLRDVARVAPLRATRDVAREAFLHAEHEYRAALRALEDAGVRDATAGLDTELPL